MPDDPTMTPEEAAAYLKVNPQTVYRNLRSGRLPGAKVGRQWRIRRMDLDRLLGGASLAAETAAPYAARAAAKDQSALARRALLQEELERFIQYAVAAWKPVRIIVFGSLATGRVHEWSDLDLAMVAGTELPFLERGGKILEQFRPRAGLDILVYTPAEWEDLLGKRAFIREEILEKGRVVYER